MEWQGWQFAGLEVSGRQCAGVPDLLYGHHGKVSIGADMVCAGPVERQGRQFAGLEVSGRQCAGVPDLLYGRCPEDGLRCRQGVIPPLKLKNKPLRASRQGVHWCRYGARRSLFHFAIIFLKNNSFKFLYFWGEGGMMPAFSNSSICVTCSMNVNILTSVHDWVFI